MRHGLLPNKKIKKEIRERKGWETIIQRMSLRTINAIDDLK